MGDGAAGPEPEEQSFPVAEDGSGVTNNTNHSGRQPLSPPTNQTEFGFFRTFGRNVWVLYCFLSKKV